MSKIKKLVSEEVNAFDELEVMTSGVTTGVKHTDVGIGHSTDITVGA